MYKARSKRERRIRFFLTYTIVPVVVVTLATAFVFMVQGYRFNASDQSVFQAGLVQFGSQPSGAAISFDGDTLSSRTRARLNVTSGVHTIGMTLDGYVPWQKTVTVIPGNVLWLTYPRLVPENVTAEPVYSYDSVAATLVHREDRLYGVQPEAEVPRFDAVKVTNGDPERSSATLPASLYEGLEGKWRALRWSESSRYVLFKLSSGDQTRWFVLDRENTAESFSLSRESGLAEVGSVEFDARDDRYLYLVSEGALRRFDSENSSLSRPIARDVVSFNQSEKAVLSFVSKTDDEARIGYVTSNAQAAKYISIPGVDGPRAVVVTEFDRRQFIASLSGAKLTIATTSLHASDSDSELAVSETFSVSLPKSTSSLAVSPNGRFIAARDGRTVHMYDLELNQMSQVNLSSKAAPLRWLGDFHINDVVDGEFIMQEFDGTNVTPIAPAVSAAALFTSDSRYIYTLAKQGENLQVVRMQLRN